MSSQTETLLILFVGLAVFWFLFGFIFSKLGKRSYDKDTSFKDGGKSLLGFVVVVGILILGYPIYYLLTF
ncbi:hypothetical protein N9Y50_06865 [Alphaproteobacteria bacterium]|nr:hypothetical protein [Alphaproteobacteria bacterium]